MALAQFEKTLSLNMNSLTPLSDIVAIYMAQQKPDRAVSRCEEQLKKSPDNPYIYNVLGNIYDFKRDDQKAKEHYKKVIDIEPDFLSAYMSLGNLYLRNKEVDHAISEYQN